MSLNSSEGCLYDEVYLAFGMLRKLMRLFGVFPINERHSPGSMKSVVNGLEFRWNSPWVLNSLTTFICITISYYFFLFDYSFLIPNPMEGVIISLFATILCWCANINLISCLFQASYWPSYFKNWQVIDRLLDITKDGELRSYVRYVTTGVTTLSVFSFITTTLTIVVKYTVGDFSGDGFVFSLICYCTCINACYLLPEICFAYLCRALAIRCRRLAGEIRGLLVRVEGSPSTIDIADDLGRLRIIYQLLMDVIGNTNKIMGPVLVITCTMNTLTLSGGVYFLVRHSLGNFGFFLMKVVLIVLSSSRLTFVCLHASTIKTEVKRIVKILYQTSTQKMTTESTEELHLFVKCTTHSDTNFTACGFVILDKELLSTVASIILTYTFTLLQFDRDLEDDGMEPKCLLAYQKDHRIDI